MAVAMAVTGVLYYLYTFITGHRFTNMGVVLFTSSMLIFFMGLISEQITALMYRTNQSDSQYTDAHGVRDEEDENESKLRVM